MRVGFITRMKKIVLTLRTVAGVTMKPEVQTSDTIVMVKAKIAEGWKLPPEGKIRLCLKDETILEDEHTLPDREGHVCLCNIGTDLNGSPCLINKFSIFWALSLSCSISLLSPSPPGPKY
jgi:hypothetical protein